MQRCQAFCRKIFKSQKPKAITVCYIRGLGGGKSKLQKQTPKAIAIGYTPKARGGGKSVEKAKAKAKIGILKSYICKSKSRKSLKSVALKSPKSNAKAPKAMQKPQKPKAKGCITYNYICRGVRARGRACTRIIFIIYNIYYYRLAGYNLWTYFITVAGATA